MIQHARSSIKLELYVQSARKIMFWLQGNVIKPSMRPKEQTRFLEPAKMIHKGIRLENVCRLLPIVDNTINMGFVQSVKRILHSLTKKVTSVFHRAKLLMWRPVDKIQASPSYGPLMHLDAMKSTKTVTNKAYQGQVVAFVHKDSSYTRKDAFRFSSKETIDDFGLFYQF